MASRMAGGVLALALAAGGCELAEVVTPVGRDQLVVEGILRAGEARQRILLHRSLTGAVVEGEPGALVVVTTPAGEAVTFEERPMQVCTDRVFPEMTDSLEVRATCYESAHELEVVPGRTYELRVETLRGEVARGRTTVPGDFRLRRPDRPDGRADFCALPPGTNLDVAWSRSAGAWSYLATLEITGLRLALEPLGIPAPERLELTGLAISEADTTLRVPAEVGLFQRGELDQELLLVLQGGFPEGVSARLVVVAADRNYVNAVRGGAFNPSGSVRISSVVGDAVGVFGSLVPAEVYITVARDSPEPPCA